MDKNLAYDRFNHPIHEGDVVHLLNRSDIMWRVQSVKPLLDPKVPPGVVELSLVAVFVTGVQGGAPLTDVLKVRDAQELKQPTEVVES